MPQRNNLIVFTLFIASLFLAAIPMDWLTTSLGGRDLTTTTGGTSQLHFLGVARLPVWLLLCGSAAATLVAGLNAIRATTVPFPILTTALVVAGAHYALPLFASDDALHRLSVSVGPGVYLALFATFAAAWLTLVRPLPAPLSRRGPAFPRAEANGRVRRAESA